MSRCLFTSCWKWKSATTLKVVWKRCYDTAASVRKQLGNRHTLRQLWCPFTKLQVWTIAHCKGYFTLFLCFFWHKQLFTRPKTYKICVYECPRVKFRWLHIRMTVLGLCPPTLCLPPHYNFGLPNSSQQHFCFLNITGTHERVGCFVTHSLSFPSTKEWRISEKNPLFPLDRLVRKQSRIACRQCSGAFLVATNLANSGSSRQWTKGGPGGGGSYIVCLLWN